MRPFEPKPIEGLGLTKTEVSNTTEIAYVTLDQWENGRAMPQRQMLIKLKERKIESAPFIAPYLASLATEGLLSIGKLIIELQKSQGLEE